MLLGTPTPIMNLAGTWVMDRELSSDPDPILRKQGVNWVVRRTYRFVTVYVKAIEHTTFPADNTPPTLHIDMNHTPTGGYIGVTEKRAMDGIPHNHHDYIFGSSVISSRLVGDVEDAEGHARPDIQVQTEDADEQTQAFLRGALLCDGAPGEGFLVEQPSHDYMGEGRRGCWVHSFSTSKERGWTLEQVWGFELVDGERCHTRRLVLAWGGKYELARFVYRPSSYTRI